MAKSKAKVEVEVTAKGAKMVQKELQDTANSANQVADGMEKTSKSAGTLDRNLKGAGKTSSNTTKNFSKMSQGMGGLVGIYASLAAQVFAISAAFGFLKRAADLQNLQQTQVSFAQNSGIAIQSLTDRLRKASKGMLDFKSAAEAAAIGVAKGFSGAQLESLAEGAGKAAAALGRNYDDTFSRLLRGVSKAEPELLDELGITLRLEDATKRYAEALGVSEKSLTTSQRSQAVYAETLRQLNENFGAIEAPVNAFQVLQTTFDDIIIKITGQVLPAFTTLANFINNNAKAAAAAFTALAALVLLNITGLTAGVSKAVKVSLGTVAGAGAKVGGVFALAGNKILDFSSKASNALVNLEQSMEDAEDSVKRLTNSLPKAQDYSSLKKILSGENLTGLDKFNIKKALDSAKKQLQDFGVVTKGMFEGATKDIVEEFEDAFNKIGSDSKKTGTLVAQKFLKPAVSALKKVKAAARSAVPYLDKVKEGFNLAGRAVRNFAKATIVLGFLQELSFLFEKLQSQPATLVDGIVKLFANAAKGLQFLGNIWVKFINFLIDKLPSGIKSIFGIEEGQQAISNFTFADNIEVKLNEIRDTILEAAGTSYDALQRIESDAQDALAREERLQEIREQYTAVGKDISNIIAGINRQTSSTRRTEQVTTGISTLSISSLIREAEADPAAQAELDSLLSSFDFSVLGENYREAIESRNADLLATYEAIAGSYTSGLAEIEDAVNNIGSILSGSPIEKILAFQGLKETATQADLSADALNQTGEAVATLNSAFRDNNSDNYLSALLQVRQQSLYLDDEAAYLEIDRINRVSSIFQQAVSAELEARERSIALSRLENQLLGLKNELNVVGLSPPERQQIDDEIESTTRLIDIERERYNQSLDNMSELKQLGQDLGDTIGTSFSSAISSVIQGTQSMKEAFSNMALSILKMLSDVIAKLIAMKILQAALGDTPIGDFLNIPGTEEARNGGIISNGKMMSGYAMGGIASGSTSGYPAILHGTEAVVPLPNGRSIPVEMQGSNQQNNVTVNVAIDNQGNASSQTSEQGANLGNIIASAVQKELQNQKRPGGILSPYGTA